MNTSRVLKPVIFILASSIFNPAGASENLDPLVLAFYYPWYRTAEFSGEWDHWNLEGTDPEKIDPRGMRKICSAHYPERGVYDSTDPEVIKRQLQQSHSAGIDAWVVSWWGQEYQQGSVEAILDTIEKAGSPLKITLYYEQVPGCRGYLCDNEKPDDRVQALLDDLEFIRDNYASHPAFLKVDDRPVLFIYTRAMLQAFWHWPKIIEQASEKKNWFLSGDCITTFTPFLPRGKFDQVHFYNPVVEIKIFTARLLRYSDFVQFAHDQGKSAAITVIPGYDERKIPSRPLKMHMSRKQGNRYERLWKKAVRAEADWILITSFNEWHEGSEIEPSIEYENFYLDLTKNFSEEFRDKK
jgi:glycoprotein endo-alpha-1,2-mannosidase